jgi:hypothetical protein
VRRPDALPDAALRAAETFWRSIEPKVDAALSELKELQGRSMELLATIHYLRHVQNVGEDQLVEILRILKPKFGEPEIRRGERRLAELGETAARV